ARRTGEERGDPAVGGAPAEAPVVEHAFTVAGTGGELTQSRGRLRREDEVVPTDGRTHAAGEPLKPDGVLLARARCEICRDGSSRTKPRMQPRRPHRAL